MPSLPEQQDNCAREQAVDPTRSCIVQAPAGSGKTSLLVERFVALLTKVDEVEQVVAITHTRKAAGEMRRRIIDRLQIKATEPHQQTSSHGLHERYGEKLNQLEARLQVMTIDALCQRLARGSAYHQLSFGEAQISDNQDTLYAQAARRLLAGLWRDKPDEKLLRLWRHYGCDTHRLEQVLVEMLGKREQWLDIFVEQGQGNKPLESSERNWRRVQEAQFDFIRREVEDGFIGQWQNMVAVVRGWTQIHPPNQAIMEKLDALEQAAPDSLDWWRALYKWVATESSGIYKQANRMGFPPDRELKLKSEKVKLKEDKKACEALLVRLRKNQPLVEQLSVLVDGELSPEQGELLSAVAHVAVLAVGELHLVFSREQQLDFTQVAHGALDALQHHPETSVRIRHLLVDEFQDTSPAQWSLIEKLVEGWDAANTLFLVGDPMQSIYGFRQAQVALFVRAQREGIGGVELDSQYLTSNFRSQPKLVEWCNEVGDSLFDAGRQNMFANPIAFTRASSASGHPPGAAPLLLQSDKEQREVDLLALLASQSQGSSVALLTQKRSLATPLMAALDQAGIGYKAVDMFKLGERQHVIDLANLARLCIEPENWRYWLGLLRAPQFGASLQLCTSLFASGRPPLAACKAWLATAKVNDEMRTRIAWLLERIEPTLQAAGLQPLAQLTETLWRELGYAALVGEQETSECLEFIDRLYASARGRWWLDWNEIDAWLEDKNSSVERAHSSPTPRLDLQVMTCHRAKGLEFDLVVLPYADNLGRKPSNSPPPLLYAQLLIEGRSGFVMAAGPDRLNNLKHPNYSFLQHHQQARELAERRRLLYVALTRAKHGLVVMGEQPKQSKDNSSESGGSFLDWLLQASCKLDAPMEEKLQTLKDDAPPELGLRTQLSNFTQLAAGLTEAPTQLAFGDIRERPNLDGHRALGVCLHQIMEELHRLAAQPGFCLTDALSARRAGWRRSLALLGVPAANLARETERLDVALDGMARDERFAWLLRSHSRKRCEWRLARLDPQTGARSTRVLDLTFLADGRRWIVDYKAVLQEDGESLAALRSRARSLYTEQLNDYAGLLGLALEDEELPIRLGVYLLLQQQWIEWDYAVG